MGASSSAVSARAKLSRAPTVSRLTGGRVSSARSPAAQCSLPHGNGRRSRAAGHGHTSSNRSSARSTRSEAIGPSHSTTSEVLLLSPMPFQSGWRAIRTRSAPRKGSRRTRRGRRLKIGIVSTRHLHLNGSCPQDRHPGLSSSRRRRRGDGHSPVPFTPGRAGDDDSGGRGRAYLMVGDLPKAKEHLAALDTLCFFSCAEYRDLKRAIERYEKKP